MIEQSLALRDVVRPGHALDAAARLAAFAPVEHDAGVFFRQVVEQFYLGVDALRRPLVQSGIEAGGRVHQERRPRAPHVVACRDAVDDCGCHDASGRLTLDIQSSSLSHLAAYHRTETIEIELPT